MKIKVCLCVLLCVLLSLCATACSKNPTDEASSIVEVVYEEVVHNESSENIQSETENLVSDNSVQSNLTSSIKSETEVGFKAINSIDYVCSRDIPGFEVVYTIERLITDSQENIVYFSEFTCDTAGVRIEKNKIYIPNDIRNSTDQILITARHKDSGISEVFDITFDGDWEMILEDDFNGAEIDKSVWDHYPEWPVEKGYAGQWSNDLTFLDGNGNLVSRAYCSGEKDDKGRTKYYAGAVRSKGLFESTYGYYEARVKPHQISGAWGSFWIVAGDMEKPLVYDGLSINGVVLTFEMYKEYNYINHGCAWDGMDNDKLVTASSKVWYDSERVTDKLFDGNFHTIGVRWSKDEYVYYIDGIESHRVLAVGGACNQPGYLNITTEFSAFGGELTLGAGEHSDMLVDYVRVYQNSADSVY